MSQKELTYKSIENEILKRITSGIYRAGQRLPPERQLEKEFAACRLTIAKGLSNLTSAGYITRTQGRGSFVCDNIPSEQRGCRTGSSTKGIIKYISPGGVNDPIPVSNGILEGIHGIFTPAGYHVGVDFYSTVEQQTELLKNYVDPIHEAFVIWPALDPCVVTELNKMQIKKFPFVLVDSYFHELRCDYIISDNALGSEIMINHLVDNGHRHICYFTAMPDRVNMSDRLSGVISGLSKHGLAIVSDTINIIPCGDKVMTGYHSSHNLSYLRKRLSELMLSANRPTAIFCSNDWIAMALHNIMDDMELKVPEHISLAGFDNIDAAQYFKVPLTTVSQNFYEMGRLAAKVILSRKQNRDSGEMMIQQRVEPQLIIRDSVRKKF